MARLQKNFQKLSQPHAQTARCQNPFLRIEIQTPHSLYPPNNGLKPQPLSVQLRRGRLSFNFCERIHSCLPDPRSEIAFSRRPVGRESGKFLFLGNANWTLRSILLTGSLPAFTLRQVSPLIDASYYPQTARSTETAGLVRIYDRKICKIKTCWIPRQSRASTIPK